MDNSYPKSGPIRGFLYWFHRYESRRRLPVEVIPATYTRALFAVNWVYKPSGIELPPDDVRHGWEKPTGIQHRGTCCWCLQPCKHRSVWHTNCCTAMLVAKGMVVDVYQKALIPLAPCDECGLPHKQVDRNGKWPEIDHRVALSVAWEYRRLGRSGWWKAWTVGNLRWLCYKCHADKTGRDRTLLATLRKQPHQEGS